MNRLAKILTEKTDNPHAAGGASPAHMPSVSDGGGEREAMNKPQPQTMIHYDFFECRNFINEKYGIDQDDYAGKYKKGQHNESAPYQNFWHFVFERGDVRNDSMFTMCEYWDNGKLEVWQALILQYYMIEFGEGEAPDRTITFSVSW